jgi:hypothetical protein
MCDKPKDVLRHLVRLVTYSDDFCWFMMSFDVQPKLLVSLSNCLSMHTLIIENVVRCRLYLVLLLEFEMDCNLS